VPSAFFFVGLEVLNDVLTKFHYVERDRTFVILPVSTLLKGIQ
jgi:hypothetical protein